MKYKSDRIINGKRRTVIVEDGKIVDKNPIKEKLKGLEEEQYFGKYKDRRMDNKYTEKELLNYLNQFYEENGRSPTTVDFANNLRYPAVKTYQIHFGSWNRAIEMAELWDNRLTVRFANEELLEYFKQFYRENGRSPVANNFRNNPKYPSASTYITHFGSWQKALKLVGLYVDSMVRKGILETNNQKGRLFELYISEHFTERSIDLAGDNCNNPIDGICPKGQTYSTKSAALADNRHWNFRLYNAHRDEIDWFYFGAFDKNYKKLMYAWRVTGDFVDEDYLYVGIENSYEYNLENMKEFDITDKFKDIDL